MIKKIIEKETISLPELKDKINDLKELKEEELNTIQRKMIEYVDKFSKISPEKAVEIKKRLVEELELDEEKAVQIINIMPKTPEEIREIFYEKVIIGDLPQKILEIILDERDPI